MDENEQCDDGNTQDGDGCSSACRSETQLTTYCGDGLCNGNETCSTCSQDCGSCGGGGVPLSSDLTLSDKKIEEIQENTVILTWLTNIPATSRVLYDTVSHPDLGEAPNYGYAFSTPEDQNKVTFHSVTISGLTPGTTYYWRPISSASPEIIGEEFTFATKIGEIIEEIKKEISLEEIGEQLKGIESQVGKLKEEVEKILPQPAEALAAEELPLIEETEEEVLEEEILEEKTAALKENLPPLEKESEFEGKKSLLAAIGAAPLGLKTIWLILGLIAISLFTLSFVTGKKKRKI